MKITKIIIVLTLVFLAPKLSLAQEIDPNFNPNNIISDADLMAYDTMDINAIQNFLQSKGSYLANYSTVNTHGVVKSAAEIIYDATHNNYDCEGVTLSETPNEAEKIIKCRRITTVNPKFILVLLQKEASLIEDSAPSQSRLDWATGYGCPDSWVCNPYYKGFGKQVNSAALQFLAYMQEQHRYTYKAGQTYTFTNPYGTISKEPMSVTPQNKATAALYNYTPHVFNGNYNVYKLWNRYFGSAVTQPTISRYYPDGSIIKANNDPKVWLIEDGKKRPFANWSSYISRFRPEQIVTVNANDLLNYPIGEEIKFANYSLVQTPDKSIYLLVDKEKRPFADLTTFKKFGFNPEELETAAAEDLVGYQVGKTITGASTYITGALLQDSKTNEIYYVEDGQKSLVNPILLQTKFIDRKIIKKTTKELSAYKTIDPMLLDEGTLVKTTTFPTVYLISGGKKRPFASETVFQNLGYNPNNIIAVSSQFLYNYDMGAQIQ